MQLSYIEYLQGKRLCVHAVVPTLKSLINPFLHNTPFLNPLKTSENLRVY